MQDVEILIKGQIILVGPNGQCGLSDSFPTSGQ